MWEAQGNEHCYFAMKLNDGQIYMIHFDELCLRQLYGQGSICLLYTSFTEEIKRAFAAQRAHGLSVAPVQMIFELSV